MDNLFTYILIIIFTMTILKIFISFMIRYIKSIRFFRKYFYEDRLYKLEDLSEAFKLDNETMIKILNSIEKSGGFKKLKSNNITMNKNYFSKYEIRILINTLIKKNKLI